MCFLKEFEECLLIMHIKYIKGWLLIKRKKKLYYLPGKKILTLILLFLWVILIHLKWWEWFLNYFLWFSSSFYVDKSFMICISKIYETHENDTKKQFTTAPQKAIHLVRRLHLGIIWAKCKVKKSNCIPPDSSDAILYCNKMVSWLSENLGPDSSITHSKILWKLDLNSKPCRSRLCFFQVPIPEWNLILFLIC